MSKHCTEQDDYQECSLEIYLSLLDDTDLPMSDSFKEGARYQEMNHSEQQGAVEENPLFSLYKGKAGLSRTVLP